jgi:hypothetical protein
VKSALVLSVVLVALLAPVIASRDPNPRRGLRRMIMMICVFNAMYLFYLTQLHPVWFVPHWP